MSVESAWTSWMSSRSTKPSMPEGLDGEAGVGLQHGAGERRHLAVDHGVGEEGHVVADLGQVVEHRARVHAVEGEQVDHGLAGGGDGVAAAVGHDAVADLDGEIERAVEAPRGRRARPARSPWRWRVPASGRSSASR